jgi:hypothetical protein
VREVRVDLVHGGERGRVQALLHVDLLHELLADGEVVQQRLLVRCATHVSPSFSLGLRPHTGGVWAQKEGGRTSKEVSGLLAEGAQGLLCAIEEAQGGRLRGGERVGGLFQARNLQAPRAEEQAGPEGGHIMIMIVAKAVRRSSARRRERNGWGRRLRSRETFTRSSAALPP